MRLAPGAAMRMLRLAEMRLIAASAVAVPLLLTAAACGGGDAPAPTATASPRAPTSAGGKLFIAKGCGACHGQDALGTGIAPAMAGHTAGQVRRQVRQPRGVMPPFPSAQLSDAELDKIIQYIVGLPPAPVGHAHAFELSQPVVIHLQMALISLKSENPQDAVHHIDHVRLVAEAGFVKELQEVEEAIEAGDEHDARHMVEVLLAESAGELPATGANPKVP